MFFDKRSTFARGTARAEPSSLASLCSGPSIEEAREHRVRRTFLLGGRLLALYAPGNACKHPTGEGISCSGRAYNALDPRLPKAGSYSLAERYGAPPPPGGMPIVPVYRSSRGFLYGRG